MKLYPCYLKMKSIFNKLIFLTLVLSGWAAYDQWETVSLFLRSAGEQITKKVNADKHDKVTTTTVYKWKNKKGEWQFSNTKPQNVPNAQIQLFRSDENVVPSIQIPSSPDNNSQ